MSRNWLGELHDAGLSYAKIAKETGFGKARIKRIISEGTQSKEEWNTVYNANRRIAWRQTRQEVTTENPYNAKASKHEITRHRKTIESEVRRRASHRYSPKTHESREIRTVKAKQNSTRFQMRIYAEFREEETQEIRRVTGYSYAAVAILAEDEESSASDGLFSRADLEDQAIADCHRRLTGQKGIADSGTPTDSPWVLEHIIERVIVEYRLRE
jgi:hypothetical protein